MNAKTIIQKYTNMVSEPSYYAGRGNTQSDLDSQIIGDVYQGIRNEIGQEAATAFVNMVADLTNKNDASATSFLQSLYRLEQYGWQMDASVAPQSPTESFGQAVQDISRTEGASVTGLVAAAGIFSLFSSDKNNTPAEFITGGFLMSHQEEIGAAHQNKNLAENTSGYRRKAQRLKK